MKYTIYNNYMYKYNINILQQIAYNLANSINPPYTILLRGNLGAGKTTFSQFFLQPILVNKNQSVTSPTFNIVSVYDTIKGDVWHVDLYRINNESEIINLGLLEFIHVGIALIEWPELIYNCVINSNIPYKIMDL
ncbi:MAG: tRNA (adenosine(37)-N6)-threonylcarbamoyltransferase complex ATPase subunit type 1 TsaE [Alphaproteobacteria bacterium]|nr:tRNA (adenosine(37)-N6)-threonylcarbamoyltransferase complex ATPase subunit type 1 TsaE [Alphaproteobacteria bacterium]